MTHFNVTTLILDISRYKYIHTYIYIYILQNLLGQMQVKTRESIGTLDKKLYTYNIKTLYYIYYIYIVLFILLLLL